MQRSRLLCGANTFSIDAGPLKSGTGEMSLMFAERKPTLSVVATAYAPANRVGTVGVEQPGGSSMTAALVFVVGMALVGGLVGLMVWADRVNRRRAQRRREAWKAAGSVGAEPGDPIGHGRSFNPF